MLWKKFGLNVDTRWQQAYISVNGIEDHRYIPEDILYVFIEPNLNRKDLYHAYVDKNNYDRLFTGYKTPRTILRNMSGKYYDGNYESIKVSNINDFLRKYPGNYILKPSIDSSQAKNVMKLQCDSQKICIDGRCVTFENIEKIIPRDFLVQEFLDQHSILKNLHRYLLYFDTVSWDIAINKNGEPVLIELNLINQGISFLQVHHGPLFGDLTEKLLEEKLIGR